MEVDEGLSNFLPWNSRQRAVYLTGSPQPPSDIAYLQTFRRDRTPPRNSKDEIFCDHFDCAGKRETFTRACEWNKHMDKHERPYKCLERGCEILLGFTYSGGLLRHNREVHKKNLSTRNPLYCPFHNCNRSLASGHGFTRLENLNEHKRRRHPGEEQLAYALPTRGDNYESFKELSWIASHSRPFLWDQRLEDDDDDNGGFKRGGFLSAKNPPRSCCTTRPEQPEEDRISSSRKSRRGRGQRKNNAYWNWREQNSDLVCYSSLTLFMP